MKKTLAKIAAGFSVAGSYLFVASSAFAISAADWLGGISGSGETDLMTFIKGALNLVISLSALVAVAILIFSGIQYITAAGDDGKVEKATKGITFAIVGLVICFIAVLIVNFVLNTLLKA